MKFFLDHDVPEPIAAFLNHRGHALLRLREVLPVNVTDSEAFAYAQKTQAILVSCNRNHFLSLAASNQPNWGLIILIRRRSRQAECGKLLVLLNRAGESGLKGNINFA